MKKGLLLVNLGTPTAPTPSAVRQYLRAFLSDKRVIDLPAPLRYLLLYVFILPFRPQKSAHAYQAIWTALGSPLLVNSERLAQKIQQQLAGSYTVALGMRYGEPSLLAALDQLADCDELTVLPLFPQYSSAATGSTIAWVLRHFAPKNVFPSLHIIRDFYQHPGFIQAHLEQIRPYIANHDYLLFSYHGIPQQHLTKTGCSRNCTDNCPIPPEQPSSCYRAQCQHTTALIAEALSLPSSYFGTAFQSRLGRATWVKPYTDDILPLLAQSGVKRLAIVCPSFVVDCLETLEEIGIRAKAQWQALGGEALTFIPCLNDNPLFVEALVNITTTPR